MDDSYKQKVEEWRSVNTASIIPNTTNLISVVANYDVFSILHIQKKTFNSKDEILDEDIGIIDIPIIAFQIDTYRGNKEPIDLYSTWSRCRALYDAKTLNWWIETDKKENDKNEHILFGIGREKLEYSMREYIKEILIREGANNVSN
jgi:hypothetical protein